MSYMAQHIPLGRQCLREEVFVKSKSMNCMFISYHAHVSEWTTHCSCLSVKELLTQNRRKFWILSDCNMTRTHNHLVRKRTRNYLATLAKWLSVCLWTKWLLVQVTLKIFLFANSLSGNGKTTNMSFVNLWYQNNIAKI